MLCNSSKNDGSKFLEYDFLTPCTSWDEVNLSNDSFPLNFCGHTNMANRSSEKNVKCYFLMQPEFEGINLCEEESVTANNFNNSYFSESQFKDNEFNNPNQINSTLMNMKLPKAQIVNHDVFLGNRYASCEKKQNNFESLEIDENLQSCSTNQFKSPIKKSPKKQKKSFYYYKSEKNYDRIDESLDTSPNRPELTENIIDKLNDIREYSQDPKYKNLIDNYSENITFQLGEGGRELLRACLNVRGCKGRQLQGASVPTLLQLAHTWNLWNTAIRIKLERITGKLCPTHEAFVKFKASQSQMRKHVRKEYMVAERDNHGKIRQIVYDENRRIVLGKEGREYLRSQLRRLHDEHTSRMDEILQQHGFKYAELRNATVQQLSRMAFICNLWDEVVNTCRTQEEKKDIFKIKSTQTYYDSNFQSNSDENRIINSPTDSTSIYSPDEFLQNHLIKNDDLDDLNQSQNTVDLYNDSLVCFENMDNNYINFNDQSLMMWNPNYYGEARY